MSPIPPRNPVLWATKRSRDARELKTGKAQGVTPEDFNERVKRLLADKPDPRKAEPARKNFKASKPLVRS
ncbi:hypothetical protein CTI14_05165 [Methylobacterium radiotolerans]|nr:hypothetical protein CTI14_05165 [Methylobacterium radiotolerans]